MNRGAWHGYHVSSLGRYCRSHPAFGRVAREKESARRAVRASRPAPLSRGGFFEAGTPLLLLALKRSYSCPVRQSPWMYALLAGVLCSWKLAGFLVVHATLSFPYRNSIPLLGLSGLRTARCCLFGRSTSLQQGGQDGGPSPGHPEARPCGRRDSPRSSGRGKARGTRAGGGKGMHGLLGAYILIGGIRGIRECFGEGVIVPWMGMCGRTNPPRGEHPSLTC